MEISKRTGRLRRVTLDSNVLVTIRATDGRIVLTMWGAQRLHQAVAFPRLRVVIPKEIASFIAAGRSIYAKHVLQVDLQLRAGDEALVVDERDTLLAVGTAHLSPQEMLEVSRGIAVRNRHNINEIRTTPSVDRK